MSLGFTTDTVAVKRRKIVLKVFLNTKNFTVEKVKKSLKKSQKSNKKNKIFLNFTKNLKKKTKNLTFLRFF